MAASGPASTPTHASETRSRLDREISNALLSLRAISWLCTLLRIPQKYMLLGGALSLAGIVYVLLTIISTIYDPFRPWDPIRILGVCLLGVNVIVVNRIEVKWATAVVSLVYEHSQFPEARAAIDDWLLTWLSPSRQWSSLIALAVAGVSTRWMVQNPHARHGASYVAAALFAFWLGQTIYCILFPLTIAKVVANHKPRLFWLSPAETPWIRQLGEEFKHSPAAICGLVLIYSVALACLAFVVPVLKQAGSWSVLDSLQVERPLAISLAAWYTLGLAFFGFSIFYPRYYLRRALLAEKLRQMEEIQAKLESYKGKQSSEDEWKEFSRQADLHARISSARETVTDFKSHVTFVATLVIPAGRRGQSCKAVPVDSVDPKTDDRIHGWRPGYGDVPLRGCDYQ